MNLFSIFDREFKKFGQILRGYDFTEILEILERTTEKPEKSVKYVASVKDFEELKIATELKNRGFGGMPIQIGYCNGSNNKLNCLEYHKNSEIIIAGDDLVLLLGSQADIEDNKYSTVNVKAFLVPKGMGIEIYGTTLHYSPCDYIENKGYRMVCVLPKGTNYEKPDNLTCIGEDLLCFGLNKWVIAHSSSKEAKEGAFVGLIGENIKFKEK